MSAPLNKRPLPPGWRWARLGDNDIAKIVMGQSPPSESYRTQPQGLPFFQGKADFGHIFPVARTWCVSPLRISEEGDVLISVRAPVGPVNLSPTTCCIGRGLAAIRPKQNLNQLFLFHYLRLSERKLANMGSGSTFEAIARHHLEDFVLPLPPLPEQQRIAARLSEQMAQVEKMRQAAKAQVEAAKAVPSAFLRQVFESEETKGWPKRRLGEIAKVFSGSAAPQERHFFENGAYPFLRVSDLGAVGRCICLTEIRDKVNDFAIKELGLVQAKARTVVLPKSGAAITTNNRAILGVDAYLVSHLAAVAPVEGSVISEWLYYWLCTLDMVAYSDNPGYPSLKVTRVASIPIPLPPIDEQKRIAARLSEQIAQAQKLLKAAQAQLEAVNSLTGVLLEEVFGGFEPPPLGQRTVG